MNILIASHNNSKIQRYSLVLRQIPNIQVLSLADVGITYKAKEPFETAKENSIYKSREYAKLANMATLAIDEAVTTNFLPDHEQPGVYVRRFMTKDRELTDEEALHIWKSILDRYPQQDKEFIWDFSISYYNPAKEVSHYHKVTMHSFVANSFSTRIQEGYPMSSFLRSEESTKPYVELSEQESQALDLNLFHEFTIQFSKWIGTA